MTIVINGTSISHKHPPFVVAEMGANHCQDLGKAKELIYAAEDVGADAIKIQAYTPDTITFDSDEPDFIVKDGPWKGRRLYQLYKEAHLPMEWIPELFEVAKDLNFTIFSSVFDKSSVDLLKSLDCPAYKIASPEIVDLDLIRYAASTGKPIIISTGMASPDEIQAASEAAGLHGCFLHCISGYPTPIEEANLHRLSDPMIVGISDHSNGILVPVAATALGALIIEKHINLPNNRSSLDAEFSLEPYDFETMTDAVKLTWAAMQPSPPQSEKSSTQMRRSLYTVAEICPGEQFTDKNVRSIRPGYGLPPSSDIWGKRSAVKIKSGTAIKQEMIKSNV